MARRAARQIRRSLRAASIEGNYSALIRRAIIQDWTEQQFVTALVRTRAFRRQHPGVVQGGRLADFLVGQEDAPLSMTTLATALANYRRLWQAYEQAGRPFGFGNLSRQQVARLIRSERSPQEFAQAAQALRIVQRNEEALRLFNEQRRAEGLRPLERRELLAMFTRRDNRWVDIYEATRLRMLGANLGLSPEEARQIARGVPNIDEQLRPTGPRDVGALVSELRTRLADIGPELEQEGISRVQLARFLADPSNDPEGIAQRLAQIEARRRARGAPLAGPQPARQRTPVAPGPASFV